MAAPNINPFENVKAMVGSYGTPADVEIRNLFANSDDDGILYIYVHTNTDFIKIMIFFLELHIYYINNIILFL